ncbi:MAG: NusG domain II-containing protein [Candidatus Ozemobacteraceae bacterium]
MRGSSKLPGAPLPLHDRETEPEGLRFLTSTDVWLCLFLIAFSLTIWAGGRTFTAGTAWQCRIVSLSTKQPLDLILTSIPDTPLAVLGRLGTSTLEWDRIGRVRFTESPCPHHVCMGQGWTNAPFTVACVPNGILVEFPRGPAVELDGIAR